MLEQEDILNAPEITKFNFGCDDIIDENIPEPLPKFSWFRLGIIGRSGSGKTNLLRNLVEKGGKNNMYCRRFSNVYYISPSVKSMKVKPKLREDNFFSSLFDLEKVIDLIQNGEDREGRNLIILDDISHELKRDGQEIVKRLFQNNRHLGRPLLDEKGNQIESGACSVMIIGQRLNALPRVIRSQITNWAIFDPRHTKSELQTIYDELIHTDKTNFNQMLKLTYDKQPYNFMFIDSLNSLVYNGFKKRFTIGMNNYI